MKEHPILFNTQSVRAILDGRQTQTRRVVRPQPVLENGVWRWKPRAGWDVNVAHINPSMSPYGVQGDQDWQSGMPLRDGWYYVHGFAEDVPVWLTRFLPEDYPGELVEPGLLWGKDGHDDPESIGIEGLSLETIRWKRVGDRLWVRETFQMWADTSGTVIPHYRADYPKGLPFDMKWRPSIHMPRWASRITLEVLDVRVERIQDISEEDIEAEGIVSPDPVYHPTIGAYEAFEELWNDINRGFGWDTNCWCWCISFTVIGGSE